MKSVKLLINNPCAEKWDSMQEVAEGRYCDNCEKTVVDLTSKSDAELIQFFKNKKANVCGRLYPGQLNHQLHLAPSKSSWHWLLSFAMIAVGVSSTKAENKIIPVTNDEKSPASSSGVVKSASTERVVSKDSIRVSVFDADTREPLPGIHIRQKGFKNTLAVTNVHGQFKLNRSKIKSGDIYEIWFLGYKSVVTMLKDKMKIYLKPDDALMGEVIVIGPSRK